MSTTFSASSSTSLPLATPVSGGVRWLLRLEAVAVLIAAVTLYAHLSGSWKMFAVLFLVPDLSLFAYFGGPRFGALVYNTMHSYVGPVILGIAGVVSGQALLIPLALIWMAHIGLDRMLGYGLKYQTAFGDTHLGRIGKAKESAR